MNPMTRILLTAFLAITVAIGAGVYFSTRDGGSAPTSQAEGGPQVVRENSHRLSSAPDSDVTFVEFLDFECEGCRAAFPAVEQLRTQYGQQVNFVARYFPMPGHFNGERAARAVEAAAQQGQFEAMYKKMFETQDQWGEKQVPADDVFRGFATELGLDMAAWDEAYNAQATLDRIQEDVADGTALGVQGTPTFFLNGEQLQIQTYADLGTAIKEALSK
ncbi:MULTISPECIES: DsbA family protein [Mycobacteriaceae]|uniref:Disulfide bond formation protein DsbA n=1 Tax=Mycolicibacterium iranicum TaxID=912594 RepID=A0A178LZJ8_MYCIR|nr:MULTISPECIES: thioredoxin domain-containing protein [Mycolicibacterium]MCZ0731834.1 thioredoxin domain-containing protein [Mycolicibacterium iranicum]MDA2894768.1 thioredoxin domain-containing protein [Mycolicibacterium sp. BiH015]OAN40375.1 thioredoxin [Mycolicibacterium iranicum]ORV81036.1 disulfide bond formation protein DsbA [Mycolicibacterium iranicum]